MRDLQARIAVITGGARGIGRGTAIALAGEGAKIVVASAAIAAVTAPAYRPP